jgi:uncharacterized membrane protein YqaE (UPF0057 family)
MNLEPEYTSFNIWLKFFDKSILIENLNDNTSTAILYNLANSKIDNHYMGYKLYYAGKFIINAYDLKLVDYNITNDSIIDVIYPLVGGNTLGDIFEALGQIYEFFKLIMKILIGLLKLIVWFVQFILWFLVDFCNPLNLATDFVGGITKITRLLFAASTDALFGAIKYFFNMFLEPIFSGFWGWDNVLTKEEKQKLKEKMKNTGMNTSTASSDSENKDKCKIAGDSDVKAYDIPDGHVPFSVILATVLLPPMGVFMEFGLTNWINIIICAILTMVYYIPGLVYALVLIYS